MRFPYFWRGRKDEVLAEGRRQEGASEVKIQAEEEERKSHERQMAQRRKREEQLEEKWGDRSKRFTAGDKSMKGAIRASDFLTPEDLQSAIDARRRLAQRKVLNGLIVKHEPDLIEVIVLLNGLRESFYGVLERVIEKNEEAGTTLDEEQHKQCRKALEALMGDLKAYREFVLSPRIQIAKDSMGPLLHLLSPEAAKLARTQLGIGTELPHQDKVDEVVTDAKNIKQVLDERDAIEKSRFPTFRGGGWGTDTGETLN